MTQKLMITNGLLNGITGLALIFLPADLLVLVDDSTSRLAILITSLLGAALFGIGMLNYLGRNAIFGGIYGKPILMGNLVFHTVVAINMVKFAWGSGGVLALISAVMGGCYMLFAVGFIRLNFFPPDLKTGV
jgi:hypothetical protein